MGAIDITFAQDGSSAYAFVGKAWLVDGPNVSKLQDFLEKEFGQRVPVGMEMLHPEEPKSVLLAEWLEKHGIKFVSIGEACLPDGKRIVMAIPESGLPVGYSASISKGFDGTLHQLLKHPKNGGQS